MSNNPAQFKGPLYILAAFVIVFLIATAISVLSF